MIYQAYDLSPSQSIFDFDAITTEDGVSYYATPFSFYLNGTLNLAGFQIEIYRNSDNMLVYNSGKITQGSITGNGPFDESCVIKPNGVQLININPILPNGDSKEVKVYLPYDSTINNLSSTYDENYNNTSYSWVLIQYDEQGNVVRNSNEFFVAKGELIIALKAYLKNTESNQVRYLTLEEGRALNISERQVYFEGLILSKNNTKYEIGNKYNYIINGVEWVVYQDSEQGRYNQIYTTGWLNTSSLNFLYENFLSSEKEYRIEVKVKYKYGKNNYVSSSCYYNKLSESVVNFPLQLRINANYTPDKIDINFTTRVCNKENYVQIFWDVRGFEGKVFNKFNQQLNPGEVGGMFINPSLPYDSGEGEVERKLNSFYLKNGSKLIYSQDYSSGFSIPYNTHQIYIRLCNFGNSFCTTTEAKSISWGDTNGIMAIFSNKDSEEQEYYRLLAINDNPENGPGYYNLQTIKNGSITNEEHKEILSGRQYWSLIGINLAEGITEKKDENGNLIGYKRLIGFPYYQTNHEIVTFESVESTEDYYNIYEPLLAPQSMTTINGKEGVFYSICNPNGDRNSTVDYKTLGIPYCTRDIIFGRCPEDVVEFSASNPQTNVIHFDKESQRFYIYADNNFKQILNCVTPLWNEKLNTPYIVIQDQTNGWGKWNEEVNNLESIDFGITNNRDTINNLVFNKMEFLNGMYNYIAIANLSEDIESIFANDEILKEYYGFSENPNYNLALWRIIQKTIQPIFQTDEVEGEIKRKYLPNTYFLTNLLTSNIAAGDLQIENQPVDKWEIFRIEEQSGLAEKVGVIDSHILSIRDYLVPNNWSGHYEFTPLTGTKVNSPQKAYNQGQPISTSWWNYSLLVLSEPDDLGTRSVDTIFYWSLNASTGEMHNNTTFNVQETLSRYKRVTKSRTNAMSGSLQCLLGYTENGVYHGDTIEVLEKLKEIQMSNKLKVLKDRSGKNYLIEFTSPISYSYDNNASVSTLYKDTFSFIQPTTIQINWIQVGDISEIGGITTQKTYELQYASDDFANLTIKRNGENLSNYSLIYEDDLLELEYTIKPGYKLATFKLNGSECEIPKLIRVSNDLSIQLKTIKESDLVFELSNSKTYYLVAGGGKNE